MKKKPGSCWWVILVLAAVIAFFDPHLGVISTVALLPLFAMLVAIPVSSKRFMIDRIKESDFLTALNSLRLKVAVIVAPACAAVFSIAAAVLIVGIRTAFSGVVDDEFIYIFPWNVNKGLVSNTVGMALSITAAVLVLAAMVQFLRWFFARRRELEE